MYTGVEHTAIASRDPESLADWYAKTLEFFVSSRYEGNIFLKASDGTMLEIIPSIGDPVKTEFKTPGIRHLAITVEDYDAALSDLISKGVEFASKVDAPIARLAFFHDPEGNILHIIQRKIPA
jgi:glyoxylase I family protein